jgi:hypothetical protein
LQIKWAIFKIEAVISEQMKIKTITTDAAINTTKLYTLDLFFNLGS